jgi:glycosyltransferase involved in cell wall biosynthesis
MTTSASSPRVTVALPTYNRAELLRQTLTGILSQDFPLDDYEVLVIDNNSSDQTRAVVESFASHHPAPRYILETRQGLDYGRNRAITEARGNILVYGDDDILVQKDWLRQLLAPLLADSARSIGAVGGEVIPHFPEGLPPWVSDWHSPLAFRPDAGPLNAKQSPMGANLAFPKWVFSKVGEFHTGLDRTGKSLFGGGDSEMIRRIRAAGFAVWFAPAASVLHVMPASRTTFSYATRHAFDSARSRVVDRAGRPGALAYLGSRFLINLAKVPGFAALALLNAIAFRPGAVKKALVRAWRSCGYLYQIPRSCFGKL